jgi:hypothetical protein
MMTTGFANHATYTSGAAVTAMIEDPDVPHRNDAAPQGNAFH